METLAHQDWRGRQRVSWRAIAAAAAMAGGVTFVVSGGTPWGTAGTMNAILGRDVPWGFPALILSHCLLSYLYAMIIGLVIYRLGFFASLFASLGIGVALYAVSGEVFNQFGWVMQSPSSRALITHLTFALITAAVYKGASVPPRRDTDADDPSHV